MVVVALVVVGALVMHAQDREAPENGEDSMLEEEETVFFSINGVNYTYEFARQEYNLLHAQAREQLTLEEFADEILIPKLLLLDSARELGYEANETEIDETLRFIETTLAAQDTTFEEYLTQINLTVEDWREKKAEELMIEALIESEISPGVEVRDEDIRDAYEEFGLEEQDVTYAEAEADLRAFLTAQFESDAVQFYLDLLRRRADIVFYT